MTLDGATKGKQMNCQILKCQKRKQKVRVALGNASIYWASNKYRSMMTSKQDQDKIYISLLGLAEYFRTTNPPNIKKCIQSLQALFTFMPPTKVVARTHLQMGQVLLVYTQNVDLARHHLEQAVNINLI